MPDRYLNDVHYAFTEAAAFVFDTAKRVAFEKRSSLFDPSYLFHGLLELKKSEVSSVAEKVLEECRISGSIRKFPLPVTLNTMMAAERAEDLFGTESVVEVIEMAFLTAESHGSDRIRSEDIFSALCQVDNTAIKALLMQIAFVHSTSVQAFLDVCDVASTPGYERPITD